jgi:hypothetical protein
MEGSMPKLLAVLLVTALGLQGSANAQNDDPSENYQVMQKRCNQLKGSERDKCLQEAKAVHERSTAGCDALVGAARQKCLTDAQAEQQSGGSQPAQSATGTTNPPAAGTINAPAGGTPNLPPATPRTPR